MLRLPEAIDRLRSPYALEDFSPLTGRALLAVDLDADDGAASPEALEEARAALVELPCPSVAVRSGSLSRAATQLAPSFDAVVASEEELAPIRESVAASPLAAMALVQLLRHSEPLGVRQGLLAESVVYSMLQAGPEFAAWRAGRGDPPRRDESPEPAVLVRRDGDRLALTLNRPERHNAFCAEMRDALVEGLRIAVCDPSIREVELAGAGPSFCSGGDLDEFGTLPDPATAHGIRSTRNAAQLLAACADRVCVRVHGACIGAGIELPAFVRHVKAHEDALFQLPELGMGLVPGAGGTVSLPRRIGRQRTAWLALSRARLGAAEALRWGLVDEISA